MRFDLVQGLGQGFAHEEIVCANIGPAGCTGDVGIKRDHGYTALCDGLLYQGSQQVGIFGRYGQAVQGWIVLGQQGSQIGRLERSVKIGVGIFVRGGNASVVTRDIIE